VAAIFWLDDELGSDGKPLKSLYYSCKTILLSFFSIDEIDSVTVTHRNLLIFFSLFGRSGYRCGF
jgi:hypothetical protein